MSARCRVCGAETDYRNLCPTDLDAWFASPEWAQWDTSTEETRAARKDAFERFVSRRRAERQSGGEALMPVTHFTEGL